MHNAKYHIKLIQFFFNTLFGNLNHFGQNVLYLVPKQKRENKKEENYVSEMRYLNRHRYVLAELLSAIHEM